VRDEVLREIAKTQRTSIRARLVCLLIAAIAASAIACSSSPPPTPLIVTLPHEATTPAPVQTPRAALAPARKSAPAPPIAWERDERDARERARRRGAPLVVYIRADWSAAALEMDRRVWSNPRVAEAMQDVVALAIDVTDVDVGELYAARYDIHAVPSTLVFESTGQKATALAGFVDVDELLAALREVER